MSTKIEHETTPDVKWESIPPPEESEKLETLLKRVAPELLRVQRELDTLEAERNEPIPLKVILTPVH